MIHKTIAGGEQWLPFALSRVRSLLATGIAYASQKFSMPDGAEVKVRVTPGHEYVDIDGGGDYLWVLFTIRTGSQTENTTRSKLYRCSNGRRFLYHEGETTSAKEDFGATPEFASGWPPGYKYTVSNTFGAIDDFAPYGKEAAMWLTTATAYLEHPGYTIDTTTIYTSGGGPLPYVPGAVTPPAAVTNDILGPQVYVGSAWTTEFRYLAKSYLLSGSEVGVPADVGALFSGWGYRAVDPPNGTWEFFGKYSWSQFDSAGEPTYGVYTKARNLSGAFIGSQKVYSPVGVTFSGYNRTDADLIFVPEAKPTFFDNQHLAILTSNVEGVNITGPVVGEPGPLTYPHLEYKYLAITKDAGETEASLKLLEDPDGEMPFLSGTPRPPPFATDRQIVNYPRTEVRVGRVSASQSSALKEMMYIVTPLTQAGIDEDDPVDPRYKPGIPIASYGAIRISRVDQCVLFVGKAEQDLAPVGIFDPPEADAPFNPKKFDLRHFKEVSEDAEFMLALNAINYGRTSLDYYKKPVWAFDDLGKLYAYPSERYMTDHPGTTFDSFPLITVTIKPDQKKLYRRKRG